MCCASCFKADSQTCVLLVCLYGGFLRPEETWRSSYPVLPTALGSRRPLPGHSLARRPRQSSRGANAGSAPALVSSLCQTLLPSWVGPQPRIPRHPPHKRGAPVGGAAGSAALGPGHQEVPADARPHGLSRVPRPRGQPHSPQTLCSAGPHTVPAPCWLSSRTCSSGDRTPPVPLVLEGLTVSRSQPWWVSSLDQLSPRWVEQCQASPASLVTQQEPPVKPAGCLSTSSTPPGSLVPRRLGGPAGMLPAPPHSLGPGCGEGYGAGGGEGGRPTAWTWEQSGG